MCDLRVPHAQSGPVDLSQYLPPRIELSDSGHNRPVLRCSGELDEAVAGRLGAALDSACEREIESLLLDFSAVAFVDGRVLALIAAARARLESCGASLRIVAAGQPLRLLRLTEIADLDAEPAPRLEAWAAPSSSSSFPTPMSERPGVAATR